MSLDYGSRLRLALHGLGQDKQASSLAQFPDPEDTEAHDHRITSTDETVVVIPHDDVGHADNQPAMEEHPVLRSNLFAHADAHPVALDLFLLRHYGPIWLTWEHETIYFRIKQDFVQHISDLNLHKLMACKTIHSHELFWNSWEIFVYCAMPLSGTSPDFRTMQVPTLTQAALAVDCVNRLRQDVEWGHEMLAYLECVHRHSGHFVSQDPLGFVEVDHAGSIVDVQDVRKRWRGVQRTRVAPEVSSVEDEQLRRMLELYEVLEYERGNLQRQLALLE